MGQKFSVTVDVTYRRKYTVYADDHAEAEEIAADRAQKGDGVHTAEAVESEKE